MTMMNSPPPHQIDPVSVATAAAALAFGPDLAAVVGPYAVIVLSSATGASWALSRRDPSSLVSALLFVVRLIATAIVASVSIEAAVSHWLVPLESHWMLAPIALLVGCVGDDWPAVGRWGASRIAGIVDRMTGGKQA